MGTHDAGQPQARLPETSYPPYSGVASCVPSGAATPLRADGARRRRSFEQRADEYFRKITSELATTRPLRPYGFCGYCGFPCRGLTCRAHRDLPALDVNTAKGVAALVKEYA